MDGDARLQCPCGGERVIKALFSVVPLIAARGIGGNLTWQAWYSTLTSHPTS